jgi:ABC-type amino acid transport system permease subunit
MLPILINQYVWLIKATTLGIAVGFSDFFMVIASSITHSGQTIELIGILMGGFLVINFSLAAVLNRLNRAIALKGHQTGGAA